MIQVTANECNGNTKLEELKKVLIDSTKLDKVYETEFNARVDELRESRARASVREKLAYKVCEAMTKFIESCCDRGMGPDEFGNMLQSDEFQFNFLWGYDEKFNKTIVDSYKLIEIVHGLSCVDKDIHARHLQSLIDARKEHYENRISKATSNLSNYVFATCNINITELELGLEEALELGVLELKALELKALEREMI